MHHPSRHARRVHRLRLIGFAVAAALSATALPADAVYYSVIVRDFSFSPEKVTINLGDTVRWGYPLSGAGTAPHNVTADDGSFASSDFGRGGSYRRTFDKAGTFRYHCTNHGGPGGEGMSGVVVVKPERATTAPVPRPTGSETGAAEPSPSATGGSGEPRGSSTGDGPSQGQEPSGSQTPGGSPAASPSDEDGSSPAAWILLIALILGVGIAALMNRRSGPEGPPDGSSG